MSTTYELMVMIDNLGERLRAAERRLAALEGRVSSSLQPAGSPSPAGEENPLSGHSITWPPENKSTLQQSGAKCRR